MSRRLLIISVAVGLFLVATGISFAYFSYQKVVVASTSLSNHTEENQSPTPTPDILEPYNVLLLGYGGPGHDGGEITDTMLIAHVIPRNTQIVLISVPRDLWVPLPLADSPIYRKINHAYALGNDADEFPHRADRYQGEAGGANLAKDMIELTTGLPIRYFAAVNFQAFEEAIDNLGSITVQVPVSFTDEFYPIKGMENDTCGKSEEEIAAIEATLSGDKRDFEFKCRFETLSFTAGPTSMNGTTALKYVRSRHSPTYGNDFSRSQRQQSVVKALQSKLLSLGTLPKLVPLINTLTKHIRTDVSISDMKDIWSTHENLQEFSIETINVSTDNVLKESRSADNQYILVPKNGNENWQEIHTFIQAEFARLNLPEE